MAKKANTTEKKVKTVKKLTPSISPNTLIHKPHVTEKSAKANEKNNVYTFIVHKNANKTEVAKAITFLYDVVPVKVRIVVMKSEDIVRRGKKGTIKGFKKAYVTVAKGQSITFAE